MSRITMCIEEEFTGKVIGSFDLTEYADKVYNQALEDFKKCAIQQSSYTETEEGWSGMTIDVKTIESIVEQLMK